MYTYHAHIALSQRLALCPGSTQQRGWTNHRRMVSVFMGEHINLDERLFLDVVSVAKYAHALGDGPSQETDIYMAKTYQ